MCDKLNAPVWSIIQAVFKKVTLHHGDYKSDNLVGHGNVNPQVLHLDPRVQEEELKQIFGIQVWGRGLQDQRQLLNKVLPFIFHGSAQTEQTFTFCQDMVAV